MMITSLCNLVLYIMLSFDSVKHLTSISDHASHQTIFTTMCAFTEKKIISV